MRGLFTYIFCAALVAGCTSAAREAGDDVSPAGSAGDPSTTPTSAGGAAAPQPAAVDPAEVNGTAPRVWNVTAEAKLGWVAAVGAGAASPVPTQGSSDPAHCPTASFELPEGVALVMFLIEGEHVAPPGAGTYEVAILGPGGEERYGSPITGNDNRLFEVTNPTPGDWSLRADSIGPAAQQVWTVRIVASLIAEVEPAQLEIIPGCA